MTKLNELKAIYEGQYFRAFMNDKKMLEIQAVSNGNFLAMVTLSEGGNWAEHYLDKMKDELDEIKEMFVESEYSLESLFDTSFMEKLDNLTVIK